MDITNLPEECISEIVSYTSPKDACRCSLVHSALRAGADSDAVWEGFLPSDYREIISQSSSPHLNSLSKKSLFFHLCDHPVLVADNIRTFALEKQSGKKCYMVGAKGLYFINWGQEHLYWKWTSIPESRFSQVAELKYVWWLELGGAIETKLLSPNTTYGVFLVFMFAENKQGFSNRHVDLQIKFEGSENGIKKREIPDTPRNVSQRREILDTETNGPQPRNDGWMEVEIGEFFNESGDDGSILGKLFDYDVHVIKGGLIVEGIEFRPKSTG